MVKPFNDYSHQMYWKMDFIIVDLHLRERFYNRRKATGGERGIGTPIRTDMRFGDEDAGGDHP
jgi:hypothetical protein